MSMKGSSRSAKGLASLAISSPKSTLPGVGIEDAREFDIRTDVVISGSGEFTVHLPRMRPQCGEDGERVETGQLGKLGGGRPTLEFHRRNYLCHTKYLTPMGPPGTIEP
jgi:hypothetical protein